MKAACFSKFVSFDNQPPNFVMAIQRICVQDNSARHRIRAMTVPALELRRIDATCNMRRFYRLGIAPDLFGGVRLVKAWGRIGTQGRSIAEFHNDEAVAADAMQKHAERKRRGGYSDN